MRVNALLICVILILMDGWFIISHGFVPRSFNWTILLFALTIVGTACGIIWVISYGLNRSVNRSIESFLNGKADTLLVDTSVLRTSGFVYLALFLCYIVFLILGVYSIITLAVTGYSFLSSPFFDYFLTEAYQRSLWNIIMTALMSFTILMIALGIVVSFIGTCLTLPVCFLSLWKPVDPPVEGIELSQAQQKRLWGIFKEISQKLKEKPVDKVIVTLLPELGVRLEGGLLITIFGGGRRVLEIGFYSLRDLTLHELKSLLAHEYAHFSNQDTRWARLAYCLSSSLVNAVEVMPGPVSMEDLISDRAERGKKINVPIFSMLAIGLNPAFWILFGFMFLYEKIESGFSRIREVVADLKAIEIYGGAAFKSGGLKLALNEMAFDEALLSCLEQTMRQGKNAQVSSTQVFEDMLQKLHMEKKEELMARILSEREDNDGTHPPMHIRLAYAGKFERINKLENENRTADGVLTDLLDDCEKLREDILQIFDAKVKLVMTKFALADRQTQETESH